MTTNTDPAVVAGDLFAVLLGEEQALIELDQCRSRTGTPTVDVQLRGGWYRINLTKIAEPITEQDHLSDSPPQEAKTDADPT